MEKHLYYDVVIVGTGVSCLYTALHLSEKKSILMICKEGINECDSMLAQGGICVMRDENDYNDFLEDTMRAGHYENRKESVEVMIESSRMIIDELLNLGVNFEKNPDGSLKYTKEGAHSKPRICFCKDTTGKEITETLQKQVKKRHNVTIMEYVTMKDLLIENEECCGIIAESSDSDQRIYHIHTKDTVLATGGIGGLYEHTTNYSSLTGDALLIAKKYGIRLENEDYVQIHPTTLYQEKKGRSFLISESARGEGAVLLNSKRERFVNELLPRDVVTEKIYEEMKKENSKYVWLSFQNIPSNVITEHFPNIYKTCLDAGYDIMTENIPVVPAQHYFMGGIYVDLDSKTTMEHLYAVGETSCNGVHGKNRLASNSLLESLVFAGRAANRIENR